MDCVTLSRSSEFLTFKKGNRSIETLLRKMKKKSGSKIYANMIAVNCCHNRFFIIQCDRWSLKIRRSLDGSCVNFKLAKVSMRNSRNESWDLVIRSFRKLTVIYSVVSPWLRNPLNDYMLFSLGNFNWVDKLTSLDWSCAISQRLNLESNFFRHERTFFDIFPIDSWHTSNDIAAHL
jgi:hypothetical protein